MIWWNQTEGADITTSSVDRCLIRGRSDRNRWIDDNDKSADRLGFNGKGRLHSGEWGGPDFAYATYFQM